MFHIICWITFNIFLHSVLSQSVTTFYSTVGTDDENDSFQSVIVLANGDFAVTGGTDSYSDWTSVLLSVFSRTGERKWSKTYFNPTSSHDNADSIYECSNGDLLVCGHSSTDDEGVLMRLSSTGTLKWTAKLSDGTGTAETRFYEVKEMSDSTIIAVGYTTIDSYSSSQVLGLIARYTSGGVLSTYKVTEVTANDHRLLSFTLDDSGNLILAGSISAELGMMSYNSDLSSIIYSKTIYPGGMNSLFGAVIPVGGGDTMVAVGVKNFLYEEETGVIVKFDAASGDKVWANAIGVLSGKTHFYSACLAKDGNVVAVGYILSGSYNMLVVKVSSSTGEVLWAKTIGESLYEYGSYCQIDPFDGGIVLVGYVKDALNNNEAAIIKLDKDGNGCAGVPIADFDSYTTTAFSTDSENVPLTPYSFGEISVTPTWTAMNVPVEDGERVCYSEIIETDKSSTSCFCGFTLFISLFFISSVFL